MSDEPMVTGYCSECLDLSKQLAAERAMLKWCLKRKAYTIPRPVVGNEFSVPREPSVLYYYSDNEWHSKKITNGDTHAAIREAMKGGA